MGRKPRIHYPGAIYHAIVRGNNREPIFRCDRDRHFFSDLVASGSERFDHKIYSFCWMTNHAHFMVEVRQTTLAQILHNLSFRYSQWFNRQYSRTGHLFERRYRSGLIETDAAAMSLVRYIHLNPVKAKMVRSPSQYRWTSHRAYLGLESIPWVETDRVLALFCDVRSEAIRHYKLLTHGQIQLDGENDKEHDPEQLHELCTWNESVTVADSDGQEHCSARDLVRRVGRILNIEIRYLLETSQQRNVTFARAVVALLGKEVFHLPCAEIARVLGRDPSAVSHAASRLAKRMIADETLMLQVEEIRRLVRRGGRT